MGELWIVAKLLGWGRAALEWLKTLPWYVLALAVCVAVILWQHRTNTHQAKELDQAYLDLAGWKKAHQVDVASMATMRAAVVAQGKAVDDFKRQADLARQEAEEARQEAARAAVKRNQALQLLRDAQAQPIKDDCRAPDAHDQVRGLL